MSQRNFDHYVDFGDGQVFHPIGEAIVKLGRHGGLERVPVWPIAEFLCRARGQCYSRKEIERVKRDFPDGKPEGVLFPNQVVHVEMYQ